VFAATLIAGGGAFSGIASADPPEPTPTPTPAPSTSATTPTASANPTSPTATASAEPPGPPPGPKTTIDQDGTYAVGTDIMAGTYSSAGPVGDGACYWKRVNDEEMPDNALTKKPQVVQIQATDTAFKTNGCQPWQLTPDAALPSSNLTPAAAALQLGGFLAGVPRP
jgi:hypothetical protein